MFKKIFFLVLISVLSANLCIAYDMSASAQEKKFIDHQVKKTINNFRIYRSAIYQTLEITPSQAIEIKKLDNEFYAQIKPVFVEDYYTMNRLSKITSKPKYSKSLVNVEKKKLKANSKILDKYKDEYEANLYEILTPAQKAKYEKLKKERIKEYKASIK